MPAEVSISYKNSVISELSESGTKTLETGGTYCEDDITITYDRPPSGAGSVIAVEDTLDEHGGTIRTITAVSLEGDTVSPSSLLQGYTAHNSLGQPIVGTASGGSGTFVDRVETLPNGADHHIITGVDISDTTAVASDVAQGKYFYDATGTKTAGTASGGGSEGVKYIYTDVDGIGAWDISGFEKCSVDYAPIRDNKARLWLKLTDNLSVSIKINIYQTTGVVDWGDGIQEEWTASPLSHIYSTSGLYVVEIQPTAGEMYFDLDNEVIGQTTSNHDTRIVGAEFYSSNYNSTRYAFRYCDNLKKVSFIGAKIKNVGSNACTSCQSLEYVEIPPTITTIQTGAFRYCSSLRKFTIPSAVTDIQGYAFDSCSSLEEVHVLPLTPPTLDTHVFTDTSPNLKIYVPSASFSAYQSATNWSDYASKMVGE